MVSYGIDREAVFMLVHTFSGQWWDSRGIVGQHQHHNRRHLCTKSCRPQSYQTVISPWCEHENNQLPPKYRRYLAAWCFALHPRAVRPAKCARYKWNWPLPRSSSGVHRTEKVNIWALQRMRGAPSIDQRILCILLVDHLNFSAISIIASGQFDIWQCFGEAISRRHLYWQGFRDSFSNRNNQNQYHLMSKNIVCDVSRDIFVVHTNDLRTISKQST